MLDKPDSLGKLIGVYTTSPALMQRAAVVAVLSFVFFMAMLITFYLRQHFGYFLLSTAFLIVHVFTMIGWWMQRRNTVEIYEHGIVSRRFSLSWADIKTAEFAADRSLLITKHDGQTLTIGRSISGLDQIHDIIRSRMSR